MFFSQADFTVNLTDFVKYYNSTEAIHAFLNENSFISQFTEYNVTTQKKHEYLTAVVSLYGLLEKFVEDIVCEYLDKLSNLNEIYSELPQEIQNNHISLSAELIAKLGYQKYSNVLTKEQIVSNLYSCLHDDRSKLVNQSFIQHNANFRIDEIVQIFNRIGFKEFINKHKNSSYFKNYYIAENNLQDNEYANESKDRLYEKLNLLATKRNEVAHGDLNNILGRDAINELVEYIKYFVFSISDVVFKEYLSHWILSEDAYEIIPLNIYNNEIICFNLFNEAISLDNFIVIKGKQGVSYRKVLEIQHNNITLTEVSAKEDEIAIGVKVDTKIKENYRFWLFKDFV